MLNAFAILIFETASNFGTNNDQKRHLQAMFHSFDSDGSGFLSQNEFKEAMQGFSMFGNDVDIIFNKYDINNDHRLSIVELSNMLYNNPAGKYSKRRRSNVAVIIVRIVFTSSILFYCLLLNHSFQTNPNRTTNCFKLLLLYLQLYNYIAPASLFLIFETVRNLFAALGQHYPCKLCRKHLKQQLRELRPIAVNTRQDLTVWVCELHNMVNKDIGHKQFDCNPFHLDMEYLKDCGECEVVKVTPGDAKSALAEKAKSGYHADSGPWDSSLYQRDPLLLSSVTSVTDAWEAKDADDMLNAMQILGVVNKKEFQHLRKLLRNGADERNKWLDVFTDAVTVAKDAIMKDSSYNIMKGLD